MTGALRYQTIAYEFETDSFDGVSVAPATNTVSDPSQQFYTLPGGRQPALGIFVPNDPSEEDGVGAYGNRWVTWVEILFDGPAPAGTYLDVVDADNGVVLKRIQDLAGRTTYYDDLGIFVPQGGALRINGGAGKIRFHVTFLGDNTTVQMSIAANTQACCDGGGGGGSEPVGESLVFAAAIVEDSGIYTLAADEIQQYDASGVAPGAIDFQMPASPAPGQRVGIKEVGDSTVAVDIDGNGALVESFAAAPAATAQVDIARASLVWQYDGSGTWKAVWAFDPSGGGSSLPIDPDNPSSITTDIAEYAALLYDNAAGEYVSQITPAANIVAGALPIAYCDVHNPACHPAPDATVFSEGKSMLASPVDPARASLVNPWGGISVYPWIEYEGQQGVATYNGQGTRFEVDPLIERPFGSLGADDGGTLVWLGRVEGVGGGTLGSTSVRGYMMSCWDGVAGGPGDAAWSFFFRDAGAGFVRPRFTVTWNNAGTRVDASWDVATNTVVINDWVLIMLRYDATSTGNTPVIQWANLTTGAGGGFSAALALNNTTAPVGTYLETVSSTPQLSVGTSYGATRPYWGLLGGYWIFDSYLTDDQQQLLYNYYAPLYLGVG